MNEDTFDDFLDEATHEVEKIWWYNGGKELTTDELYALNDLLTQFFADKK